MIRTPQRSVTRFFIPLIDVLILLFCIFLLMPFVSRPEGESQSIRNDELEALRSENQQLSRQLNAHALAITILEIEASSGKLFVIESETGQRVEISTQAQALQLIAESQRTGDHTARVFVLLFPRVTSGFPLRQQLDLYRLWFQDVRLVIDNPGQNGTRK